MTRRVVHALGVPALLAAVVCCGSSDGPPTGIDIEAPDTVVQDPDTAVAGPLAALVNECADPGPGWVWCDDFEVDRLDSYFEVLEDEGSFQRAFDVGVDGSAGMRARFATGQVSAGALHLAVGRTPQTYFASVDGGTAHHRDLYWRIFLRHQDGWVGGGGRKLSRAFVFASQETWAQAMIAHVWGGAQGDDRHYLVLDPASGTTEAGVLATTKYNDFDNLRWLGVARAARPIFRSEDVGVWYCIEARARLNDPGQADGVFQLWIDGELEAERTGLNFVGAFDAYGLNAVYLENYWNEGSPADQERYMDNFVVSTERIGCGEGG